MTHTKKQKKYSSKKSNNKSAACAAFFEINVKLKRTEAYALGPCAARAAALADWYFGAPLCSWRDFVWEVRLDL